MPKLKPVTVTDELPEETMFSCTDETVGESNV